MVIINYPLFCVFFIKSSISFFLYFELQLIDKWTKNIKQKQEVIFCIINIQVYVNVEDSKATP